MDVIKEGLLKVDPGLLLWTIITFAVLLLILWKAAWKPIIEALDNRAEKVRGDIEQAEKSRQEAETLLVEHKELMSNAKKEAGDIIAKGKEEAEIVKNDIIEKASKESKDIVAKMKREIDLAKEQALVEIKNDIVLLSIGIAEKIIDKNLNEKDQLEIVEDTLNKFDSIQ